MNLEEKIRLQKQLRSLTKTTDWLTDPITRTKVDSIRSKLYPNVFTFKGHRSQRLIK
ncbi:hypothetical protein IGK47_001666 [Enterococcus sp. AZ007]